LGYNRVLTLYDGIRQEGQQWGDEHGIEVDAYQVQKAELIKGPASLMYGSDALAGVVSFFSFIPTQKDSGLHGRLVSEYQGNNGLWGNSLRLQQYKGRWLWSLSASQRLAKNYRNAIDGRVYLTGFHEKHAAAMVGYTTAKSTTTLHATLYDNIQGIPDGSRDSLSRRFTKQVHETPDDDIKNRPIVSDAELNSYRISPLHQHIQHYRVYAHTEWNIGKSHLDALLAYQQNVRREYNHPANISQPGLFVRLHTLNYSLRYNIPLFDNAELAIGANGMYQHNVNEQATDFPIPDYRLHDIGLYSVLKWKHRNLTLSAGARQDRRYYRNHDFYVKTNPATGFSYQARVPDTAGAVLQFSSLQQIFSGTSFSAGFTYKLSDILTLKGNVARAFRAPNVAEMVSNGLDPGAHIVYLGNRDFKPEFSFEQDLGLLAGYKNWNATLSLFRNHIAHYIYLSQLTDAQGNPVVIVPGNKTYQYKQADAQLYGLESSVTVHLFGSREVMLSNSLSLIYGYNQHKDYRGKGINGEYLPFIPPFQSLTGISKSFTVKSKRLQDVSCSVEWQYMAAQNRYLALDNTETATSSYQLVNIGAGASFLYAKARTIQVQLQVNNLFNTAYQSNVSRLKYFEYYTASPNGHLGIYNMGFNACIKIIASF
jgi:iron complex outermembrane receptor protein